MMSLLIGAGGVSAQNHERLSPDCRRELIRLCFASAGRDRQAIAACALEKRDQISATCKTELRARMEQKQERNAPGPQGGTEYAYGSDAKQKLDFWSAPSPSTRVPLMIFVHGGGWSIGDKSSGTGTKPEFFKAQGFAFASLNYRLVPSVKPDDQARDLAKAVFFLRQQAAKLGLDPDHIVMMGHSAGAHLAALLSSDTRYLSEAGVPLSAIYGTVLLDGAGYNVPKQMGSKGTKLLSMYEAAFTKDEATQLRLSPITYAGAPNTPRWLILHDAKRVDSGAQSQAFAMALKQAGALVSVESVPGSSHMAINRDAGVAGTVVGNAIAAFLKG